MYCVCVLHCRLHILTFHPWDHGPVTVPRTAEGLRRPETQEHVKRARIRSELRPVCLQNPPWCKDAPVPPQLSKSEAGGV